MPNPLYLAMTAAEFFSCAQRPAHIAWMACHFAPYGTGLSNLPRELPPHSLLIVNDRIEPCGHDSARIARELRGCVAELDCDGVVLDLQRRGNALTQEVVCAVCDALPCPVAVAPTYDAPRERAVFVPAPPLRKVPASYFSAWAGRELWLEAASEEETLCLTAEGCRADLSAHEASDAPEHYEPELLCHYRFQMRSERACFHFYRTPQDLSALLRSGAQFGVTCAVGLWQELHGHIGTIDAAVT